MGAPWKRRFRTWKHLESIIFRGKLLVSGRVVLWKNSFPIFAGSKNCWFLGSFKAVMGGFLGWHNARRHKFEFVVPVFHGAPQPTKHPFLTLVAPSKKACGRCAGRGCFLMKVSGIYRNDDDYVTSSINADDFSLDMIQQLILVDSGWSEEENRTLGKIRCSGVWRMVTCTFCPHSLLGWLTCERAAWVNMPQSSSISKSTWTLLAHNCSM